jgi:hypothetical protein
MAATEDCAQRACLRMADVTVMHSVTTRSTGSTAMVARTGRVRARGGVGVTGRRGSAVLMDDIVNGLW